MAFFLGQAVGEHPHHRQAEVKYQSLVEHIAAVVFLKKVDQPGPPLYISPRIRELTGYSPEDWYARPDMWESCLHPDDRERILAADSRSNLLGTRFFEEYRLIRRDGTAVWVKGDTNLIRDQHGNPLYRQGILFDITKEEGTLGLIRKSEERFRRIFHASPIATCVVRAEDGICIDANQAYLRLVGRSLDELLAYHILPKFAGKFLKSPKLAELQFWMANASLIVMLLFYSMNVLNPSASYTLIATLAGAAHAVSIAIFFYNMLATLLPAPPPPQR